MKLITPPKPISNLIIVFLIASIFASCSKTGNSNPSPQNTTPTIASLSVTTGPYNTLVNITGTNFSTVAANDHVLFNGKAATVSSATTTQLTVNVPLSAGTGPVTLSVNSGTIITGPVFTYQFTLYESIFAGSNIGMQGFADGVGTAALFSYPSGLTFDTKGNLFVADNRNESIRKITPDGTVSTYIKNLTNGVYGIVADAAGNLYCTQLGAGSVLKITPTGNVSTLASNIGLPYGIGIDGSGNLYVTDGLNSLIKKISPSGVVTTFAGITPPVSGPPVNGPGSSATFMLPMGIAVDAAGNVYVADTHNAMIRKITPQGVVSTLAGTGKDGSADGPAASASFSVPTGVAVDANGNVYVADQNNGVVRKISAAGVVTTIAGIVGLAGVTKDGPANSIALDYPGNVAVDATGNVYVSGNAVISKISLQ